MKKLLHLCRLHLVLVAMTLAAWLASSSPAWAQAESPSSGGGAAYVAPYALVIFSVALGVFIVCNPARRRERARPEDYQQRT